ncbi:MAG: hypothetical protein KBD06_00435, partial [Candidatus Pacebacteria bacterium]|nr:hypothetical protein [Candidatus Paceibacterota bacterium]
DAILRKDASRDLEHEIARHEKEAAEERDLYSQYLSTEQMGDLGQIELAEEEDIDMYMFLLAQERLIERTPDTHSGVLPVETARAHFTADSFYSICKHLTRSGLDTPEVMQYTLNMMDGITDVSSVPLLLSVVDNAHYYDEQYEQRGVIERACRQLCGIMRDVRYEESIATRAMVADRMITAIRTRGVREELATVLATTGTVASVEYFTRRQYRPLGDRQMLALHRGDFSSLDLPEQRRQRDRYGYDESHEQDHGFDHYDRWDDESYEGDSENRRERSRENNENLYRGEIDPYRFSGKGLRVNAHMGSRTPRSLEEFAAKHGVDISKGEIGSMDFTPEGSTSYTPEKRTQYLLAGYEDLKQYFDRVDNGELRPLIAFEGFTNSRMAKAALIFGFHLAEGNPHGGYRVVGFASEVRQRLDELSLKMFNGKDGLFEKMRRRAERQAAGTHDRWAA